MEVHLSNVFAREEFRSRSLLSDIAIGLISGFGEKSYDLGLQAILAYLQKNKIKIKELFRRRKIGYP